VVRRADGRSAAGAPPQPAATMTTDAMAAIRAVTARSTIGTRTGLGSAVGRKSFARVPRGGENRRL
jgi:hypothetical protein